MEFFILGAWLIWTQRNDAIFNRGKPSFQSWKRGCLEEASLQAHRLSNSKQPLFVEIHTPAPSPGLLVQVFFVVCFFFYI
jgi:hypothetical protein